MALRSFKSVLFNIHQRRNKGKVIFDEALLLFSVCCTIETTELKRHAQKNTICHIMFAADLL